MNYIHFIFIFLIIFVKTGECITCKEAVNFALKQSETIHITNAQAKTIKESGKQSIAFIYPQITTQAHYLEMDSNKEDSILFPFLNSPNRDVSASIQFSQLLFAGGRLWMSKALKDNFDSIAGLTKKMGKRELAKEVRLAFYQSLYQQAAINILKDRLKQRKTELEDAIDLRNVGVVTSLDVRQARLSLNLAKDELNEASASYQDVLIEFNTILGISSDKNDELFVPEGSLSGAKNIPEILKKLNEALKNKSLIDSKMAQLNSESNKIQYKFEKAKRFPELSLIAQAKKNGDDFDNCFNYYQAGAQITYPLFDGFLIRSQISEKYQEFRKSKEQEKKTNKILTGNIRSLHINHESIEKRIGLQKQAVQLSKENYEDARGQYRAGAITMTHLGEFNLSYAEARFNLLRIYYIQRELYVRALALLEFL